MNDRIVLGLVPDLFFGARLGDGVRTLGYEFKRLSALGDLLAELERSEPALVIVDLSARPGDLGEIVRSAGNARLMAFGPHVDTESRRAAKEAGFHEVVTNGRLSRELPVLLARNLDPTTSAEGGVS